MNLTLKHLAVGLLLLFGVGACADLEVVNQNDADASRALASAGDVESLIAGAYNTWWSGVFSNAGPGMFLSNQAFQHNAPWSNRGMEQYGRLPRVGIVNDVADNFYGQVTRPWYYNYRALAALSDGLKALEKQEVADELGPEAIARARAYAKFVQGTAHATLAIMYDRGFIVDETTDLNQAQEPVEYMALMQAALGYFDDAIALCSTNFTLPFGWLQADVTNQDLSRIASSYKARFYAAVARTPAQRGALDWNKIISWVESGIQDDFLMYWDWDNGWYNGALDYSVYPYWTQMSYWIWGMADQSGNYQEWLSIPLGEKSYQFSDGRPVLIVTPDLRFPQGETVEAQRTTTGLYFRIATAMEEGDTWKKPERGVWRWSWYKNTLMTSYGLENQFTQPEIRMEEMDLLKAEGLYRNGDLSGAAALINKTRTAAGLNATDATGMNTSCVPKLPNGSCGDLWEMLKWEKRTETAHTGIANAGFFYDSRAWGDLWFETPLQFPVPCKELQVLQMLPCNTYGGPGGEGGAAKSTYAWPFEG